MMALRVFFVFLLVLFLSGQGYADYCYVSSSVIVEVTETGRIVKKFPVYEVVLNNTCICTQSHVVLSCDGFSSYTPLKPEVLKKTDGGCLVNDGQPIHYVETFKFQYAGTLPTKKFAPVSSWINCS